jgi:GxxExxY protein
VLLIEEEHTMKSMPHSDLTRRVIGCAIEVHRHLGPGLVESVYETCLCDELAEAGLTFARQRQLPILYKTRTLNGHFQLDVIVEEALVLEIKAVHQVHPIYQAQLMTYLRLSGTPLGLLMNFNIVLMKDGIIRVLNPNGPRQSKS